MHWTTSAANDELLVAMLDRLSAMHCIGLSTQP
jgi:hypothetical protein